MRKFWRKHKKVWEIFEEIEETYKSYSRKSWTNLGKSWTNLGQIYAEHEKRLTEIRWKIQKWKIFARKIRYVFIK